MLKIRPEQLEAFQPSAEAAFESRVIEYLRFEHADVVVRHHTGSITVADIKEEPLLEMIRTRLQRARDYGMSWESSLMAFMVLTFVVSPTFDHQPAIRRVLLDETIEPDLRIDQLWEQTSEEDWEAAAQEQ
jgi:hypothetical protein